MNLENIIDEVILEKKEETLKCWYNIDVFIQEFQKDEEETEEPLSMPETGTGVETGGATETEEETPATESTEYITEAIYKNKGEGELVVSKQEAMNIQTVDDLLDYLSDKKISGKPIIDKISQEVILIMMNINTDKQISDIINEGDKFILEIDYGKAEDDSIGFKVNKKAGTKSYSLSLKKDGKIHEGAFNLTALEQQILYYRNSIV